MTTVTERPARATRERKPEISDRARAETRLGQKLVAPAIVLMLVVTAFPMIRALYLSLFRYSLTAPDDREFVGLSQLRHGPDRPAVLEDTVEHGALSWWSRWASSW